MDSEYTPPFSKKNQLKRGKQKKKPVGVIVPESGMQKQCNESLEWRKIDYIRISDPIWVWLQKNAPVHIVKYFSNMFKSRADNTCFDKVSDKYTLAMNLELKRADKDLTSRQSKMQKKLGGVTSRSTDETEKAIEDFLEVSNAVKCFLKEYLK